ncbi:MAG: PAS domain-containing protein [Sphingobium sp.]
MAEWRSLETDRAALLAQYDLDAGGFATLDRITDFAAALCDAPIAMVSIVEDARQRFLARTGLDAGEMPREFSFCAHAMREDGIFLVPDARSDPRFAGNALVTGAPHVRFYAGVPLVDGDGMPLGALCVIADRPRPDLTALQRQGLFLLAGQVMAELQSRRQDREISARQLRDAEALAESNRLFRTLADTMPQLVWAARADGYNDYFNAGWYDYIGVPVGSSEGAGWVDIVHPDDKERAVERWRHSLKTGEPYEIEYRLRYSGGGYRWTLGRARPIRDDSGQTIRWIGTCTDIHEQKILMEEREMIAHELSHRIKNIFSVIGGLIGLSAREHPEMRAAADDLRERILSLGRAHDFVRPHGGESASSSGHATLRGVMDQLFAPYRDKDRSRFILSGDDPEVDDRSATPLALLFHELATNAAKYGALSAADGKVRVHIAQEGEDIRMDWREEGGPPVPAVEADGFGSRLMALSVERQLGGRMVRNWLPGGLEISVWIPRRAMHRAQQGKA